MKKRFTGTRSDQLMYTAANRCSGWDCAGGSFFISDPECQFAFWPLCNPNPAKSYPLLTPLQELAEVHIRVRRFGRGCGGYPRAS